MSRDVNPGRLGVLLALILICSGFAVGWPDVPPGHWANQAVASLVSRKLIAGYPDGRFHGDRRLSRYETAALLLEAQSRQQGWRSLTVDRQASLVVWHDVPRGHWAHAVVETMGTFGWVDAWPGVTSGWFSGAKPASRYEWAVAVASLLPETQDHSAAAMGAPAWAGPAVAQVQRLGIMVGDPDGRFHGERTLTRYEAAVALAKTVALLEAPAAAPPVSEPAAVVPPVPEPVPTVLPEPLPSARPLNLPRLTLGFAPEYLSEVGDAGKGEARGWAMAASQVQADWAEGPLALMAGWRYAMYGLSRLQGESLPRRDQQLQIGAGYRWLWGTGERRGEARLFGLGTYFGRQVGGGGGDDLLAMDMQAFGLGGGAQLRWPVAQRLVAVSQAELLPVLGSQFGPDGAVSGQLGWVSAAVGLDWYLERLSVGLRYRLRYVYDGDRRYSQWANGLTLQAGLGF